MRIGTDIVDVESVAESIREFGDRYLYRLFTARERAYCAGVELHGGNSAPHYAARFAAKEAVIKLLRPKAGEAAPWIDIEIVRRADGACDVKLHGAARSLARRAHLHGFAVSMSHERRYATAVAFAKLAVRPVSRGARVARSTSRDGATAP